MFHAALRLFRLRVLSYMRAYEDESTAVTAAINVNKPYKPRRLKMDPAHIAARRLRKLRYRNPAVRRKLAIQRKKYLQRNGRQLKRRAQRVRDLREQRGLD